ncbi:MAG: EAL domain-containing protein, partial [Gammaproteobacteria bacterium]
YSLERLNNIGVQNSLDDFGTGYSSLSYLKRYPIHHLKIDKSFVQDVNTHEYASSIVTAIIAMAKGMRMGVTAEGVETSAQKEYLDKLGCTEQQGFYYSRPMGYEKLVMQMSDRHVADLVCVDR